jgi:hypothetical protein
MKQNLTGILLMVFGVVLYNIYGKEITTKGLKRADGTYFKHRVVAVILIFAGLMLSIRSLILKPDLTD